ncbi:MAG: Holliday junction resolvase RuvX [Clostridia bacterium]|nr:Holliday junction resolvase RuvX [Clostridia bacterium]
MRILGIDYGDRRTGIAMSDETEFLASVVCTIKGQDADFVANEVFKICNENKVGKIVLGLPKNMDGSSGFRVEHTMKFKEKLKALMPDTEIIMFDERMTTMAAAQYMNITDVRGKKRKENIDALAAKIILQDYLDSK